MKSKFENATQVFGLIISIIAVLLFVQSIPAQETRGVIKGTVTDPNNAPVPGASVKIIDPARGTTLDLKTNDDGFFQANYLFPGTYQIVVETTG